MFKGQEQEVGNGSLALQAGGSIQIHMGVTPTEARTIALDVAKATFAELSRDAREIAQIRVEEITEQVIRRLEHEYPEGLQKALDPDFQYALFTVQKQYGRTGDSDLGLLLVNLLVDRSKQGERNLLQIVLNESLGVAPKLTSNHFATLAGVFLIRYVKDNSIDSIPALFEFFDRNIESFADRLSKSASSFQHLEFAGCGTLQAMKISLHEVLIRYYPGLFMRGFDVTELEAFGLSKKWVGPIFTPCLHDLNKLQVNAIDDAALEGLILANHIGKETGDMIRQYFSIHKMDAADVRAICVHQRPYMKDIFDAWDEGFMGRFNLTSVGIAIGHAYLKQFSSDIGDLSLWLD